MPPDAPADVPPDAPPDTPAVAPLDAPADAPAEPPTRRRASTAPTCTVSPVCATISSIVPSSWAITSCAALSVSSSTIGSSTATLSPTFLNHSPTSASVIDSPACGTVMSTRPPPSSLEPALAGGSILAPPGLACVDGPLSEPFAAPLDAAAGLAPAEGPSAPAAAPESASSCPSSASTPTISPTSATISPITPSAGAGTSSATLSVSSVTSVSPRLTGSPGFLSHSPTSASATDSPRVGTRISVGMALPLAGRPGLGWNGWDGA